MKTPSKHSILSSLAYSVLLLSVLVLGCIGWSYQFERPYLTFTNLPFPTALTVHAGQPVELAVERCNRSHTRRSYMTTHSLRNEATGSVELLPDVWVDIEPGCTHSVSSINVVPAKTAPGIYTVSGVARIDGLVVIHRVPWSSRQFQVLPAEPAPARERP